MGICSVKSLVFRFEIRQEQLVTPKHSSKFEIVNNVSRGVKHRHIPNRHGKRQKSQSYTHLVRRAIEGCAGILHAHVQRVFRVAVPQAGLPRSKTSDVYPAVVVVELPPVDGFVVHFNVVHLASVKCFRSRHCLLPVAVARSSWGTQSNVVACSYSDLFGVLKRYRAMRLSLVQDGDMITHIRGHFDQDP